MTQTNSDVKQGQMLDAKAKIFASRPRCRGTGQNFRFREEAESKILAWRPRPEGQG